MARSSFWLLGFFVFGLLLGSVSDAYAAPARQPVHAGHLHALHHRSLRPYGERLPSSAPHESRTILLSLSSLRQDHRMMLAGGYLFAHLRQSRAPPR